jgi:hypothetical protein
LPFSSLLNSVNIVIFDLYKGKRGEDSDTGNDLMLYQYLFYVDGISTEDFLFHTALESHAHQSYTYESLEDHWFLVTQKAV